MARRVLMWGGLTLTVAAAAGLGAYLSMVGLDKADKLASVLGLFVAVAGLVLTVYGVFADRRAGDQTGRRQAPAAGKRSVSIGGDSSGIVSTGDDATNIQSR
ncbi:hypothetical protein [Actinoallomurus rhizosphaericola]|uniref:hypothetical protein n=1 Tax=Actinoallomurus rhizosphaericola TaxID=2952536 RepID=UPI002093057F|nr:hypothetical protein [Actinoallomurus rhizosphaericola]MCO5996233.1 hypothetical protein [Actinoallomurus rhizosphaericola]